MRSDRRLNILQISTRDRGGGAERVAYDLLHAFADYGHTSRMVVGYKHGDDPNVTCISNELTGSLAPRTAWRIHQALQPHYRRSRVARIACRLAHAIAEPGSVIDRLRGVEDFRYPGTHRLLQSAADAPDIIYAHNLHGNYFDLRALPALSRQQPFVMTLHDAWLISGHCAHSLECERWREGCGKCPDLALYPAVRKDATALNWKRKQTIFARSELHVATPCQWLMRKVESSMLMPGIVDARIIPYGVDLSVFQSGDKSAARHALGIDSAAHVLLFAANSIRNNKWKDYATMRSAVGRFAQCARGRTILFLALGESGPPERIGDATIQFIPFIHETKTVAQYYQAADVYIHAARADTFPCTVLESLACGTPVVATAVGGIPEQIKSLNALDHAAIPSASTDSATGLLVGAGDGECLAHGIEQLMDSRLRRQLGENAGRDAAARFDLHRHADDYLGWYADILDRRHSKKTDGVAQHAMSRESVVASAQ